jgi:hypothetical protein
VRRSIGLGLLLGLLTANPAFGSPEDIFGYGPRSAAMGATGPASSQGFEAAYANPALLARIHERTFSLGFQGATFHLYADGVGLPGRISYERAKGILIGLGLPIPFGGVLRDRVGAALAFYTPTDILVRGRILYPETPQFLVLPDRAQSLAIRLGFGLDVGYGVRVGAGFAALAQIQGSVTVATDATGHVGSQVQDQLIATYAPIVGLTVDLPFGPPRALRLGATYRGRLAARFAVEIDATKLSTINVPIFNIAGLAQYDPAQLAFEAAYDTPSLTVAAGVTYKQWSDYPGPVEATIACPPDNPGCGALTPTAVPFHDTLAVHVGVDRGVAVTPSLTAHGRAGYFFEPTPLPDATAPSQAYDQASHQLISVPTRYFDATRHVITLGAGLDLRPPLPPFTFDIYGQAHLLEPRTVTLSPGPSGDPSTTTLAKIEGHVLMVGMVLGVRF